MVYMPKEIDIESPFGSLKVSWLGRLAWQLAEWRVFSILIRKPIRSFVGLIFDGPYDEEIDGIKYRIYPIENYDDRKIISKRRLPEQSEHNLLVSYLNSDITFVDVGANIGTYTLFAAKICQKVVAIEANSRTVAKLVYNSNINLLSNVEVINVAAGDSKETLQMWSVPSNSGFATLEFELTKGPWKGDWQAQTVEVQRLTDIFNEAKVEGEIVMKIDVEGFEDRVLVPFFETANESSWPKVILLEINCREYWKTDVVEYLSSIGYRAKEETVDNLLLIHQSVSDKVKH